MDTRELKDRLQVVLNQSHAIIAPSIKAGRELTAAERERVGSLMDEAQSLRNQIHEAGTQKAGDAAADDDLRQKILDLGAGMDGGWSPSGQKAGPWSKAFIDHLPEQYGRKDLTVSGSVAVPSLRAGITPLAGPAETVLQLIPGEGLTGTDQFSYLQETVRTQNAAPVAVGGTKPTSIYTLDRVDDTVRTIAHLSEPIPKQRLSDTSLLRRYVDGALREGLILALEDQVINGDGSGTGEGKQFVGLMETSGAQTVPYATDVLTTTRKGITALQLVNLAPSGWVFHPSDWETVELAAKEEYASNPKQSTAVDLMQRRLWGYPVALSIRAAEGTAILADFAGSTHMWEREKATVDWSENVYDPVAQKTDFEKNLIRFRAECRAGFGVLRPAGVVLVSLSGS